MQTLTRSQIERLMTEPAGPCVSIYMPTHRRGAETQQNPIRLKNLIRAADHQLQASGCTPGEIEHLLQPLTELVGDYGFWQHQMNGLMVFRTKEMMELHRVDVAVPELAVVGDRPHLKPMLALMTNDARFYVLALSQNRAQLYHGTREGLSKVEVEEMPANLEETMPEGREPALQSHASAPTRSGGGTPGFHGHGSADELAKERLPIYFREIDRALATLALPAATPLFLAAVDYLVPIYRKASTHAGLQAKWIPGNPDTLSPNELHARALPLALECFEAARKKAADRYLELWHTQQASNDLKGVLPAAYCGRVDTLFAAVGVQVWGEYSTASGDVRISETQAAGDEDLLNLAAIHAYLNGGSVYAVAPDQVPGGGVVAAVYRF